MTRHGLTLASCAGLLLSAGGCGQQVAPVPQTLTTGVALQQEGMAATHADLSAAVSAIPSNAMNQSGLAAAVGGARVRLMRSGSHEILIPIPQLADGQVPVNYFIKATPSDAVTEYRLRRRGDDDMNVVVSLGLKGEQHQEVQIEWTSMVLIAGQNVAANTADPDRYRTPTACAQAKSAVITKLADSLWPENGELSVFAANIQQYVRHMKQAKQPRSLDAEGILDSGASGICTANANLALALMRAKGVSSRSVAVIPPNTQRLEMHRTVEFFDDGQWVAFDPSSLRAEIPMKPWHIIVMAKTTIADEQVSMKPRMGAMLGCPYAQELEVLTSGVTPWGQDFFWTMAKPMAEFDVSDEAIALATDAWNGFLESGTISTAQVRASAAKNDAEFVEFLSSH